MNWNKGIGHCIHNRFGIYRGDTVVSEAPWVSYICYLGITMATILMCANLM